MFGGADPSIDGLVPRTSGRPRTDVPNRRVAGAETPSPKATAWTVKNLFELKNARRVLIEGKLQFDQMEHAQNGFAILFTVRNQDGGSPWSTIEDVTFTNNLVRHVGGGVNVLGHDDNHPSQQTRRLFIHNNVFLDVGTPWGAGRLFQLLDGTNNVDIAHNTALQTGSILFGGDHAAHTAFAFQSNVAPHNEHGIIGSGTEPGNQTIARYFPRAIINGNVIVGGNAGQYPPGNTFARSLEDAGIGALRRGELKAGETRASRR